MQTLSLQVDEYFKQESFPIKVLLVDDQPLIAEAIKEMLEGQKDITLYYCKDPAHAIDMAEEVSPTVILQDLVMPEVDGLTLARYFRANPLTEQVPLIVLSTKEESNVKAECFAIGVNDYIVKLPDKVELIARIRYHSLSYTRLLERNEAYEKLRISQSALLAELSEAAEYVRTLLPKPLNSDVVTQWRFLPSTQLGGDAFGYHSLDQDHFVFYLLDVCGHGVGAALLSITVLNLLRSQGYSNTDFKDPKEVLSALNRNFQMEKHNNMFFTMWYGVFNKKLRQLTYSSGGHPPVILFQGDNDKSIETIELRTPGFVVGGTLESTFVNETCTLKDYNRLFVFSDGVYEITKQDGTLMKMSEFVDIIKKERDAPIDTIVERVKMLNCNKPFDDDFSLLELEFKREGK